MNYYQIYLKKKISNNTISNVVIARIGDKYITEVGI
jgi:hypothetical protein